MQKGGGAAPESVRDFWVFDSLDSREGLGIGFGKIAVDAADRCVFLQALERMPFARKEDQQVIFFSLNGLLFQMKSEGSGMNQDQFSIWNRSRPPARPGRGAKLIVGEICAY